MNNFTKKAISVLTEMDAAIGTILTDFCKNHESSDFQEVKAMYDMVANLHVLQSQYADSFAPTVKEGELTVHNDLAMIEIDGVQLIGDIQFEIFMEDKWIKGHRMNSPMGQAFIGKEGSWILYDGIKGRVSLPLIFDNSMAMKNVCIPSETYASIGNACQPAENTCMSTGNACQPAENACMPIGACMSTGNACQPAENACMPMGACMPTGNVCSPISNTCMPIGACMITGNTCSPVSNTCMPIGACMPTGNACQPAENACMPINNACFSSGSACSATNNWMVF